MKMNRTSVRSYGSSNTQNASTDKMALDRSDSSVTKLCDLHVYKVPPELWRDNLNNVLNNAVTETVSVGIIRVPEELRLAEMRDEVSQQLTIPGVDLVPRDFVFLRSVGRSLTTLRGKQEQQLKAKHFLPPVAAVPELYILEVTPEVREALAISDASSSPLSQRASPSHRNGYRGTGRDNSSDRSQNGGFSQGDLYGRRHRGQDGGRSRHTKGNNSENDSEDELARQKGNGGNRNTRKSRQKHSDEDEQGLSSDDDGTTRGRQQKLGHEKNRLSKNLEKTRMSRHDLEKEREELMRKAKQIQRKTTQYRNEARDVWKKKYFEEKKRTMPLEDTSNILQNELEALHRKQINILEGPREKNLRLADGAPSEKSNHVIVCARLRHEIDDLSRRVEMARMKLTSEMKLRVQAQAEMKAVRSEAMQNRQALRAPKTGLGNMAAVVAAVK